MKVEKYFFRYAFPCLWLKLERKEISKRKYHELEKKFLDGEAPSKKELEKIFYKAFIWIKRLAKRRKREYWNPDVMREYWEREHNRIIRFTGLPEEMQDLCKIIMVKVVEKKPDSIVVRYKNKTREVSSIVNVDKGDYAIIHHYYAIEKV